MKRKRKGKKKKGNWILWKGKKEAPVCSRGVTTTSKGEGRDGETGRVGVR